MKSTTANNCTPKILHSSLLSQAMNAHITLQSKPSSILSDEVRKPWLEALGSLEPDKLDRRLLWDNLDPTKLEFILKNAEDEYANSSWGRSGRSTETAWKIALDKICRAIEASKNQPLPKLLTIPSQEGQHPFSDLWQPAVEWAISELRHRLDSSIDVPIHDRIFTDLASNLLARFCFVSQYALLDLFNAERGVGSYFLAYLGSNKDDSHLPKQKLYHKFIQRHRNDGLTSLLREFPVLGRLLGTVLVFWLDSNEEMLQRIHQDRKSLQDIFNIPIKASLSSIQQGISDHHCEGKTVAILTFTTDSDSWKIVYKPRDISLDAAYQQVLAKLNEDSRLPPLMTLKVLKRSEYGYVEFVEHQLCKDERELQRFYYNAGRLSAILYILGCTDCHHENLIAQGDRLVLIDTETLLEPSILNHIDNASKSNLTTSRSDLQKKFQDSILRTNLIPSWLLVGVQKYAVDLSALGINPPAERYELVGGWVKLNTDEMHFGKVKLPSTLPTSLPVEIGKANPFKQHIERFLTGFKEQSLNLMQRRNDWLKPGGIYDRFVNLPRRIVLRATRVYFSIQIQQLQPEALRSEFQQGMKLEQLARFFLIAETKPKDWSVFSAEMQQMEQLDIPYFFHQIDDKQLPLCNGKNSINNFFENSGLDNSRQRLKAFDLNILKFQIRLIKGAVQAKELRVHSDFLPKNLIQSDVNLLPLSAVQRLCEAQKIAKKIVNLSFDDGREEPEWLGLDWADDCDRLVYKPLSTSLYSGSIGIAAFFACLLNSQTQSDKFSKIEELEKMIRGMLKPLIRLTERQGSGDLLRWWRDRPIGLGGCAGQLLTLIAIDEIGITYNGFKSGREICSQLLDGLRESYVLEDPAIDLLGGSTGLIGALLLLNTAKSVRLARLIGDRLVETQEKPGGWIVFNSRSTFPPFGFSHGVAGIVAGLGQLYQHTKSIHYRDAAHKALVYEREQFNARMNDWSAPHFNQMAKNKNILFNWCHGLSGSVLGRLCLLDTELWDSTVEKEVKIMLDIISRDIFSTDSVCCGSFGRIAILRLAHQKLKNKTWRIAADRVEKLSFQRNLTKDRHSRYFNAQELSPNQLGFMNGLSGIGLILLDNNFSYSMTRTLLSAGLLM